jgi:hypothetical protein
MAQHLNFELTRGVGTAEAMLAFRVNLGVGCKAYTMSGLFSLCCSVLNKDPYHSGCLPVHISCLVELKKVNSK